MVQWTTENAFKNETNKRISWAKKKDATLSPSAYTQLCLLHCGVFRFNACLRIFPSHFPIACPTHFHPSFYCTAPDQCHRNDKKLFSLVFSFSTKRLDSLFAGSYLWINHTWLADCCRNWSTVSTMDYMYLRSMEGLENFWMKWETSKNIPYLLAAVWK